MIKARVADRPGIAIEDTVTSRKLAAAVSAALAAFPSGGLEAKYASAPVPDYDHEKCYGIAKAGHNDCQSSTNSCGNLSTADAAPAAWIYLPRGTCGKIVGGDLKSPG